MKKIKRVRLPYNQNRRHWNPFRHVAPNFCPKGSYRPPNQCDDEAPRPIIIFPAAEEIESGEYTLVSTPRPHRKLSRADYARLRCCEANRDDNRMYLKLVTKAEKEGIDFVKLLIHEMVKVVPDDYLEHLIEYYYRIKASTGPTGPWFWTDERLEEFTEYANEAIKLVKVKRFSSLRAAILKGKIFPDEWFMDEEKYYKVKKLAESKDNIIEPMRKAKS